MIVGDRQRHAGVIWSVCRETHATSRSLKPCARSCATCFARLDAALAQNNAVLAQNAELVQQVAWLNERVAELLPVAKRKARKSKPTAPSEASP